MWSQRLGLAGQRLGHRRRRTTNLLPNNRHAHDPRAGARRRRFDRSDRFVAGNLLEQLTRRAEERQHDSAAIKRFRIAVTNTNTNTNSDTNTDANTNAHANTITVTVTVTDRNDTARRRLQR